MKKPKFPRLALAFFSGLILTATAPARAASYIWTNTAGGNWNSAANWVPNGVPGATDNAAISTTGNYTVTVNDTESIGTLTLGASSGDGSVQTLNLSSGMLTVNNASTGTLQSSLNVSGGTLTGAGSITMGGPLTWTGGSIQDLVQCNGGSITGNVNLYGALVNSGALGLNAGLFMYGGVLTNLGTFNLATGSGIIAEGGSPDFDNDGQMIVSASGAAGINTPFNNAGTVAINSGTLEISGGGTESGSFTVASGATLNAGGGTFGFNSGTNLSGPGTFTVSGGTANVTGPCTMTSNVVISAGTLNLTGSGTVTPATASISGGTEEGSQTMQVTGVGGFAWAGGSISGTVQCNGGSITGNVNLYGALVNSGALGLNAGLFMYGGVLTNLGTFNLATGSGIIAEGGSPDFDNDGQMIVSASGAAGINTPFNNAGTVAINSGTLEISGGGTESGSFTVASGATLNAGGGTFGFNSGTNLSGPGTFTVSGGTANVTGPCTMTSNVIISAGALNLTGSGTVTPATASISGGTEEGSQTMQVTGVGGFAWTGGSISGTVQCNGGSITGNVNLYGALVNSGALGLNAGLFMYGGVLTNLGTFNLATGSGIIAEGGSPDFDNDGQMMVSASGAAGINTPFNNAGTVAINSGTLEISGGGTESGSFTVASGATLNAGGGTFGFNSGTNLSGPGTFTVSGGTANVTGPCTMTSNVIISAGALNLTGSGTVTPATASISGGTEEGSQTMQVTGVGGFAWAGGSISGTVQCNGGSITGNVNLYGALVNSGALGLNAGLFMYGGVLTNLGTFNLATGSGIIAEGGSPDFDNDGQMMVSASGAAGINTPFNNAGTVAINSGTLEISGGGTESGSFTVASGATLNAGGGTFGFNSGTNLSGPGTFTVSGGTANVTGPCTMTSNVIISAGALNLTGSGTVTPATASISGGTEEGSQTMQVTGVGGFAWAGGSISGTVQCNGGSITGNVNLYGALVNSGALGLNAGLFMYGGVLTNLGTFNLATGSGIIAEGGSPDFDNDGQMIVSASGAAGINTPFNNAGTVAINSGTLSLTGAYNLTKGALNFVINNTNSFGALDLSGSAALTCALGATFNGYTPRVGDSFGLITYGSDTGVFSAFNLPNNAEWAVNYGNTVFTIKIIGVSIPAFYLQVIEPPLLTNAFTVLLLAPIGSNYVIQAASDPALRDWVTVTNFTSVDTSFYYTDTTATNRSFRLFRAVLIP